MFVENSNIPNKDLKTCISSININNMQNIKVQKCLDVYDSISYHADIQMIHIGNNEIIIEPNMYDKYINEFEKIGLKCIKGQNSISNKYPKDVCYNGCIIGDYFIHNLKYTDPVLLEYVKKKGLKCINVEQGYTKCNISIVNACSFITQDMGIYSGLKDIFDILYIQPDKSIKLGNMQGFIGGATGLIGYNKWFINGDINRLREKDKILDFLKSKNVEYISIPGENIVDIGSIIPIKYI